MDNESDEFFEAEKVERRLLSRQLGLVFDKIVFGVCAWIAFVAIVFVVLTMLFATSIFDASMFQLGQLTILLMVLFLLLKREYALANRRLVLFKQENE